MARMQKCGRDVRPDLLTRLHCEVAAYDAWISPTQEEHACRVMVIQLLQHVIREQWPDADVRSFGSQDTRLYLPQGCVRADQRH